MKIQIEKHEEIIFQMVLNCSQKYFKNSHPRVAGGWVRDKIMGHHSFDIDITLNNVSGYDFASKLKEIYPDKISTAGLVKQNPEKSKHLETAVLNINGHFIDFVNLRKETYSASRIPLIEFGTPYEDAHRRDLTINALFYNLETKEIEDFTEKGIKDLQSKTIRTPLDPETTFRDDPLRILRIFRFYSKFNFRISENILKALRNEDLKTQLSMKVSKERINIEIFKMIEYPKGHLGILEMIRTGYIECVFGTGRIVEYESAIRFHKNILELLNTVKLYLSDNSETFEECRWIFNLYLILHSWSKEVTQAGKKPVFTNAAIVKNSLVCSNKIHSIINRIEKGLTILDKLNLSDTLNNSYLIVFYFKDLWLEILVLESALRKQINKNYEEILRIIKIINKERILEKIKCKSTLDISSIDKLLGIEPKYISYFFAESIIFWQSQKKISNADLISHLKNNKEEIIARHTLFK